MSNSKFLLSLLTVAVLVLAIILGPRVLKQKELSSMDGQSFFDANTKVIDWEDPNEPMQSSYLKESEVPAEAIRIIITAEGFSPDVFEVEKNQRVELSVRSGDEWSHILQFEDQILAEWAVAVGAGKISNTVFNAPQKPGEYVYRCGITGHTTRGEYGKMIVK